ncbi:MAG: cobaltochelatase subunit CobN, partial [Cyanobacteria bacterium J06635_13]
MHKLAALPGGWNPNTEGVILIEQSPAPIIFLTYADTDIQTLAAAQVHLEADFPDIRAVNLANLQQQLSIDVYLETVVSQARAVVLRILGGSTYWSYGFERIKALAQENKIALFVLPGDNTADLDLISHSTVSLGSVNRLWRYLIEGGSKNYFHALQYLSDVCWQTKYNPELPKTVPNLGIYTEKKKRECPLESRAEFDPESDDNFTNLNPQSDCVILFYRSHYLAGNTAPIDRLYQSLIARGLQPLAIFIDSLRNVELQQQLLALLQNTNIKLLLNTTSFSLAKIGETAQLRFWQRLNVPILQVILGSCTEFQWQSSSQGLMPRDVAMNVALPEVDGRIISRAVSFKSVATWNEALETNIVVYQPQSDRLNFVADSAANWIALAKTPVQKRKVAL